MTSDRLTSLRRHQNPHKRHGVSPAREAPPVLEQEGKERIALPGWWHYVRLESNPQVLHRCCAHGLYALLAVLYRPTQMCSAVHTYVSWRSEQPKAGTPAGGAGTCLLEMRTRVTFINGQVQVQCSTGLVANCFEATSAWHGIAWHVSAYRKGRQRRARTSMAVPFV